MVKTNVVADIPVTFLRFLQSRNNERVLEVVLVYNGVDRYDTIIKPDGLRTAPDTVMNDYNHKGVDTGAYLTNLRTVKNYEIEGVNGEKQVLESALIAEAHIPDTAEMFYFDKDGVKRSNGNLKEAIDKGHVKSVSVEFKPIKQKTNTRTGITTFTEWDLIRVSFLDVAPGQPYSSLKVLRYFDTSSLNRKDNNENKTRIMPKAIHDAVNAKLSEQFETDVNVDNLKLITTFDYDGATHQFTVDYTEDSEVTLSDFKTLEVEESVEEDEDERGSGYDDKKMRELVTEIVTENLKPFNEKLERALELEDKKEKPKSEEEQEAEALEEAKRSLENQTKENSDTGETSKKSSDKMQTQARALGEQGVQYIQTEEDKAFQLMKNKVSSNINPYLK